MTPTKLEISVIDVALIDVAAGRRKLDPAWVETLADLFQTQGQKSPIEVIAAGDRYRLVFGHHRLGAAKRIGADVIQAVVKSAEDFASEADIVLAEITENLARRELSVLDRAVDIARWRELYEATHLIAKPGRKAKPVSADELTAKFAVNFSVAAQTAFGLSERNIFRAVKVASIPGEVRDRIALHAIADNQSELLALAAAPPSHQANIAALLTSEPPQASSVADAVAIIERLPAPQKEPRWQKVASAFSSLKEAEQDRFFALHEAAIQRWQKARSA